MKTRPPKEIAMMHWKLVSFVWNFKHRQQCRDGRDAQGITSF